MSQFALWALIGTTIVSLSRGTPNSELSNWQRYMIDPFVSFLLAPSWWQRIMPVLSYWDYGWTARTRYWTAIGTKFCLMIILRTFCAYKLSKFDLLLFCEYLRAKFLVFLLGLGELWWSCSLLISSTICTSVGWLRSKSAKSICLTVNSTGSSSFFLLMKLMMILNMLLNLFKLALSLLMKASENSSLPAGFNLSA